MQPNIDNATFDRVTIDHAHHEVHEGNHYFISNFATVGSGIGSSLWFDITVPNNGSRIHLFYEVQGTLVTRIKLFEGATLSGGTTISKSNSDRNSSNNSILVFKSQPTVSGTTATSGTLISASSFGLSVGNGASSIKFGGVINRENELILKSGITYLLEINSSTDLNLIDYIFNWYEIVPQGTGY